MPGLRFEPRSVDATAVPPAMQGFRTLFTCLHHFPPQLVKAIVADAVAKGEGLGVFEITSRDSPTFFSGAIWMPLSAWLFPLLRRPFRLDYFFCANVVPLGPLVNMHDGLTSCLRTYRCGEGSRLCMHVGRLRGELLLFGSDPMCVYVGMYA